jgi:hypothetical protein
MNNIIFLKIGWMEHYKGISDNDKISSGAEYIKKNKYGHEMFNFMEYNDHVYGYVQVNGKNGKINIQRLGASKSDEKIDNVTVVWTAPRKNGGVYIIGWYQNATIYRKIQVNNNLLYRKYKNKIIGFNVYAKSSDVKLLSTYERTLNMPNYKMNRSFLWYADDNEDFVMKVKAFIKNIGNQSSRKKIKYKIDIEKKRKVEKTAIDIVSKHFKNLKYEIIDVQDQNVGWDLYAKSDKIKLKLEVKGLSRNELQFILTPNEYKNMEKYKNEYLLCIVTKALCKNYDLNIFCYSEYENGWIEEKKNIKLNIEEKIWAHFYSK